MLADPSPDGPLRKLLVTTRLIHIAPTVFAALLFAACGSADKTDNDSGAPSPTATGTVGADVAAMPPWPAPVDDVPARVEAAGLDLGPMGTAEHYHPRLEISIGGKPVQVPANIGVDPYTGAMSAVHTHETDGTIHIEADSVGEEFTLGQFFTQWGVQLTSTQIGGVKAEPGEKVVVTSNGTQVAGDPRELRLEPEQVIVLRLP